MLSRVICLGALVIMSSWAVSPVKSASITIDNASFEAPAVDPNAFPAVPFVDQWTEIDVDTLGSTNTGVFANTPAESPDHVVNAHGSQLVFLGSQAGNALEQDLIDTYRVGCDYRLTVAVGVSSLFSPSIAEPVDTLELVLYYSDANEPADILHQPVDATALFATELTDVSLYIPAVQTSDAWAGKTIGVALRAAGAPGGFWVLDDVRLTESVPALIPIDNASFEAPAVDPNAFPAVPFVDQWTEIDVDTLGSTNTGVFANTPAESPDHFVNAHGSQLVFLGSQAGNALEQGLIDTYRVGCDYRLTVAVGISNPFSPSIAEPVDTLELVLYYSDANEPADILHQTVDPIALSATELTDVSLYIPAVQTSDAWAGKTIGVALRATGAPGGFWVLDDVRLTESVPALIPIDNASFEAPAVDPNAFPALPFVDQWIEIDVDTLASANTGVFANTAAESWDHINNADGQQLVFLGSEYGNALEQDLTAMYEVGCNYRLTVAVGISSRFAPSSEVPVDILELVLFYRDGADVVDIVSQPVDATGLSPHLTTDVSLYLPTVQSGDAWADMTISVALRSIGMPGGFWVLDHVRLAQSLPDPDLALTVME